MTQKENGNDLFRSFQRNRRKFFVYTLALITFSSLAETDPLSSPRDFQICEARFNSELRLVPRPTMAEDAKQVAEIKKDKSKSSQERRQELEAYAYPGDASKWGRALVLADYAMLSLLGYQAFQGFVETPHSIWNAILLAPPVLFVSDLISQFTHKWFDSFGSEQNRFFGDAVRRFRQHHEAPYNLDKVSYLDNAVTFSKISAPVLVTALLADLGPAQAFSAWLFILSLMNATECHKQAHLNKPNKFFAFLQKARLAIGHREHMKHHTPPYDGEYSVLNGWANPIARKTEVWTRLDKLWWKYVGKMPHNWIQDPRSIPVEVIEELVAEFKKIPDELFQYQPISERRFPTGFDEKMKKARERWQLDYISKRRQIYLDRYNGTEDEVSKNKIIREWQEEQEDFPWLFNVENKPIPLFQPE